MTHPAQVTLEIPSGNPPIVNSNDEAIEVYHPPYWSVQNSSVG